MKEEGNSVNYEHRMHDPRIGRFFAIDLLASDYPWNSPYAFSENRVVDGYELEGLEVRLGSKLPILSKFEYDGSEWDEPFTFVGNVGISILNGFASTWNYAGEMDNEAVRKKDWSVYSQVGKDFVKGAEHTKAEIEFFVWAPGDYLETISVDDVENAAAAIVTTKVIGKLSSKSSVVRKVDKSTPSSTLSAAEKRRGIYIEMSPKWASGSLKGAISKYANGVEGVISPDGTKTRYTKGNITVIADNENNYFRIYDHQKKQYLDSSGKLPSGNKVGLKGKEAIDYEKQKSHIKNSDK